MFWGKIRSVTLAVAFLAVLAALYNAENSRLVLLLFLAMVSILLAAFATIMFGEPGEPSWSLPAGSWTILAGNTDVGFHHIIVKETEGEHGRYFRIPVSQLPFEEVDEVGGFGGYPREKKTLKVTREGDLARVDILKGEPTPPPPGPPPRFIETE